MTDRTQESETDDAHGKTWLVGLVCCLGTVAALAAPPATAERPLSTYFPPTEERGGWRSLLPESGDPDSAGKAKIRQVAGVDWDKLDGNERRLTHPERVKLTHLGLQNGRSGQER
jgi:hypothetical protein